eukprot:5959736-Pleurochrysis_carterae.AAC.1
MAALPPFYTPRFLSLAGSTWLGDRAPPRQTLSFCASVLVANYDNRPYQACASTCLNATGSEQKAFLSRRHNVEALSHKSATT